MVLEGELVGLETHQHLGALLHERRELLGGHGVLPGCLELLRSDVGCAQTDVIWHLLAHAEIVEGRQRGRQRHAVLGSGIGRIREQRRIRKPAL